MIPSRMHQFLQDVLPKSVWKNRLIKDGPLRFLEFGPLDVDRLQRLGIKVDRLGPRLVSCMWNEDSPVQIGGFLVVDNLAMGQPSMGGTRMLPDITPDIIHNLARGMTLKNAAADLPFGGGKSGIVKPENLCEKDRHEIIKGFGQLLNRYKEIYIPGPDVGTNDADMKTFAIENGLNNVVSKPADMGGNRIDELGGAANGIVVATKALLEHLPKLKQLPQFKNMVIPKPMDLDILIQGFGAVGAHVARIFHDYDPDNSPIIKGISDEHGYLLNKEGLPWKELFDMWKEFGAVTRKYFHDHIMHEATPRLKHMVFSNSSNNLLTESAFCLVPASPVFNYLDVDAGTNPSMTTDRMGKWQIIVEGANTYSPNPARKAERRRMERHVYRDKGVLIATDYLVNSGGVIYAAHERIVPTPDHLLIPKDILGNPTAIEGWLEKNRDDFATLAEIRRKTAVEKLETVIRRNMEELIDGLCKDADSLPCEIAEKISVQRIAAMEKSRTARDIMEDAPTISVDKSVTDAARLLVDAHVPIVNVVSEKGKLIGIVTNWDITKAMASKLPMDSPLTKVMTADVITNSPDATIIDCIRKLENHEISAMPIVEDDKVIGVISGDILARRTLYRLLQTLT
ncbi:MAG: CBS domain-containing protein [Proteobacteria bacterium]|nr:CBS domain-containing protein [Pseudomonadota bacterium]MBU1582817.1 CBS domain-containing protein [Pseudomonadota bacterium]MBU2452022.1 CBS domain-containing protein [Pseudomonadota bacterium]MBU2627643.1 CBS domain-containing protein [Pseudomonadota bacterium]